MGVTLFGERLGWPIKAFVARRGGILVGYDRGDRRPRMNGVAKAFPRFFAGKPEPLVEQIGSHYLVVKVS
jgi:hypothetical protein